MLRDVTRSTVIQVWFVAVALVVAATVALGLSMTLSTAALLAALCLVPPVIVLKLWPGVGSSPTVGDVLHGSDRRD